MPRFEEIAADFRRFAEVELQGHDTPMYERLAAAVARDDALLELASHCPPGQPRPNLLLGAVQYLLALHPGDTLASHYPSVSTGPQRGDLVEGFARFCREHRDDVIAILQSRIVQTNEVGRSALLLPAFHEASRAAGRGPARAHRDRPERGAEPPLRRLWHRLRGAARRRPRLAPRPPLRLAGRPPAVPRDAAACRLAHRGCRSR